MRAHSSRNAFAIIALCVLFGVSVACVLPRITRKLGQDIPTDVRSTQESSAPAQSPLSANAVLPDPTTGLDGLQNYQVTFDQTAQGTLDGNPYERSTHLRYTRLAADEELVSEISTNGSLEFYQLSLRKGDATYTLRGKETPCQGGALDEAAPPLGPAARYLIGVNQADKVGDETVNGIPAVHYRFSQAGLAIEKTDTQVSGEVWIASQGGYVVKYLLSAPAPASPAGEGLAVGQTWDYELRLAESDAELTLPEGCLMVPVDIPALADAVDVQRSPGLLTYGTPSDVDTVINFYAQTLPEAGWENIGMSKGKDDNSKSTLFYTQGPKELTIYLDSSTPPSLVVTALLSEPHITSAALAPSETSTPAPPADFSQSGLPADVPLYPGASNLELLSGFGARFTSADTPQAVLDFYKTNLGASGWTLTVGVEQVQVWDKDGKTLNVIVSTENGVTDVSLMTMP